MYGFLLMAACVVGYNLGSSLVNDVVVRGRVVTDDGRPLAHEELELIVPATYGLSVSERGNPSRFGHETRPDRLIADSDGEFVHSFGSLVYHQDIFFGIRIPNRPPALVFFMRVPRVSPEYYYVDARQGRYRVFSEDGVERLEARAPLVSLTVREDLGGNKPQDWIAATVELRYESTLEHIRVGDKAEKSQAWVAAAGIAGPAPRIQ